MLESVYQVVNSFVFENILFFIFALFAIFSYIRFSVVSSSTFFLWLFFLPATILHELLHFTVGLILFAKPKGFSLIPKKENGGYTLGQVTFSNLNFINTIPTALAPIIMFGILFYIDNYFFMFVDKNIFYLILLVYINNTAMYSAIPSSQDFKVAFSNILGLFFYTILISLFIGYFLYQKGVINV
jgi:hypothetical protein